MPGFNPDKINIHDLTMEEPELSAEESFNPEKYITEKDLEWMQKTVKKYNNGDWEGEWPNDFCRYLQQLKAMQILGFPEKLFKRGRERLREELKRPETYDEVLDYAATAGHKITPRMIERNLRMLNISAEGKEWETFVRIGSILKTAGKSLAITPEEVSGCERMIKNLFSENRTEGGVILASRFRIINNDYKLPPSFAEQARKRLEELHDNAVKFKKPAHWLNFSEFAADMAVLSADDVHIPSGGGIELIYRKKEKLQSETPAMPEQKQF